MPPRDIVSRFFWPVRLSIEGLVVTWPWRHGHSDCVQTLIAKAPELEAGLRRNPNGDTRTHNGDLVPDAHLTAATSEVPQLFNLPVTLRARNIARSETKVSHAAALSTNQQPHLASIWRRVINQVWQADPVHHWPSLMGNPAAGRSHSAEISPTGPACSASPTRRTPVLAEVRHRGEGSANVRQGFGSRLALRAEPARRPGRSGGLLRMPGAS
jgi:hypothetical protein